MLQTTQIFFRVCHSVHVHQSDYITFNSISATHKHTNSHTSSAFALNVSVGLGFYHRAGALVPVKRLTLLTCSRVPCSLSILQASHTRANKRDATPPHGVPGAPAVAWGTYKEGIIEWQECDSDMTQTHSKAVKTTHTDSGQPTCCQSGSIASMRACNNVRHDSSELIYAVAGLWPLAPLLECRTALYV